MQWAISTLTPMACALGAPLWMDAGRRGLPGQPRALPRGGKGPDQLSQEGSRSQGRRGGSEKGRSRSHVKRPPFTDEEVRSMALRRGPHLGEIHPHREPGVELARP